MTWSEALTGEGLSPVGLDHPTRWRLPTLQKVKRGIMPLVKFWIAIDFISYSSAPECWGKVALSELGTNVNLRAFDVLLDRHTLLDFLNLVESRDIIINAT